MVVLSCLEWTVCVLYVLLYEMAVHNSFLRYYDVGKSYVSVVNYSKHSV